MDESINLNKNKLENPDFMEKLIDAMASNVEKFLDDPRWLNDPGWKWTSLGISRDSYADTKTAVDAIKEEKKLDGLNLPADVFIIMQTTCHSDFGLTPDETYKVLGIYFSEIFLKYKK